LVELNVTQVELAESVGTSKQYLGKILHGLRSGAKYLEDIDRILGLNQEERIENVKNICIKCLEII